MKKIISLVLVFVMLSASSAALASDEIYSQANKTAEIGYELDIIASDTVIEKTADGKNKVSVKVKNYGDEELSAMLIATFKEKETGFVYDIDTDSLSVSALDTVTLSAEVLLPEENVIDNYEFKYYVWDDLNNMIAIGNTAPHKPENLKVKEVSNSTITLSWDASKDDAGELTYNVYCGDEKIGDTTETTFTHYGLESETTYNYCIEAVDDCALSSGKSSVVDGITSKVVKLILDDVKTFLNGDIAWNTTSGGTQWVNYDTDGGLGLFVNKASTFAAYDKNFAANKTTGTFGFCEKTDQDGVTKECLGSNNLQGDRFMIRISDNEVLSSKTKTVKITILDNEQKTFRMRYSPETGYRKNIDFNLTGSGKWITLFATVDDSYTQTSGKDYTFELGYGDLEYGEIYIADIEIVGGKYVPKENSGEDSGDDSGNIDAGNTAPNKPGNFKVEDVSTSTVTLSWDAVDAGEITYNIYCGDEKIGETTDTTFTHSGLEDDTTYSYSVEAVDGNGVSSGRTEAIEGTTLKVEEPIVPNKPENLKVEEVSNSTVTLSWDAVDAGEITYNIYCGDEKIGETTETTFTHSGLEDDTTYRYSVEPIDGNGVSLGKSSVVDGKTLKVMKLSLDEVKAFLDEGITEDWRTLSNGTKLTTHYTSGGLGVYEQEGGGINTYTAVYDSNFATNKTAGTYGFCSIADSDSVTKACLAAKDLPGDKFYIAIPDGDVLSSAKKTLKITILDNEAKTFRMRYVPTTGSRKTLELTLTGTGKWVTLLVPIEDTYTGPIANKGYVFELGYGTYGSYFPGEMYIADIEIVGGKYVPKESIAGSN